MNTAGYARPNIFQLSPSVAPANAQSTFLTNHQMAGTALTQKYIVFRVAHLAYKRVSALFHPLKTPVWTFTVVFITVVFQALVYT